MSSPTDAPSGGETAAAKPMAKRMPRAPLLRGPRSIAKPTIHLYTNGWQLFGGTEQGRRSETARQRCRIPYLSPWNREGRKYTPDRLSEILRDVGVSRKKTKLISIYGVYFRILSDSRGCWVSDIQVYARQELRRRPRPAHASGVARSWLQDRLAHQLLEAARPGPQHIPLGFLRAGRY